MNPFDHNQLATLVEMDMVFDRSSGQFRFERVFDFSKSPQLEAEEVAESWSGFFEETDAPGSVSTEGDRMTLRFESGGINTRHDLKPPIGLVTAELAAMVATHDGDQALEMVEGVRNAVKRYGGGRR